jgi:hypothetical protein
MARAQRVENFGDVQWVISMTGHGTSTMNPNGVLGFELVRFCYHFWAMPLAKDEAFTWVHNTLMLKATIEIGDVFHELL